MKEWVFTNLAFQTCACLHVLPTCVAVALYSCDDVICLDVDVLEYLECIINSE